MKRKLLLLCNPGTPQINFVQHVSEVLNRYKAFFQSAVGGYWSEESEIDEMPDGLDSKAQVNWLVITLADYAKHYDYSAIVFVGHGASCPASDIIQLSGGELVKVKDLYTQVVPDKPLKRTIIIDACRSPIAATPNDLLFEARAFSGANQLKGEWCKEFYNNIISDTEAHIELVQSTQSGGYAFITQNGTVFSDSFFSVMRKNTPIWNDAALGIRDGRYSKCVKEVFDMTKAGVNVQGQIPQYSRMGGTGDFPLYAVWRALDRNIQSENSGVVDVICD